MGDPVSAKDLAAAFNGRLAMMGSAKALTNTLVSVYYGERPPEYDDLFPDTTHEHTANWIRHAIDDHAGLAAKVPSIIIPPKKNTDKARNEAEKAEKVFYGYNDQGRKRGGISFDGLMKKWAWWIVCAAEAVGMVVPDFERKTPYFIDRDPRHHFPPVGWTPWGEAPLDGTMFVYATTYAELKLRYPNKAAELDGNRKTFSGMAWKAKNDDTMQVTVAEYYHSDAWYIATIEDKPTILLASESGDKNHPGICPVVSFEIYGGVGPRSHFADQISLQVANDRILTMKLESFEQTLWPIIISSQLQGNSVKWGAGAWNFYDTNPGAPPPRVDVIRPELNMDADQMMGMLSGFTRMLNRDPEQRSGAGDANSQKALEQLMDGTYTQIKETYWPPFEQSLPKLYNLAAHMDMNLWGNESKSIYGDKPYGTDRRIDVSYRPNTDLRDYCEDVKVDFGIGLAGPAGTVEIMQRQGAGWISRKTAMAMMPSGVEDIEQEYRAIAKDKLEDTYMELLLVKAQNGEVPMEAIPKIAAALDEGKSLFEAAEAVQSEIQAQLPPVPEAPAGVPPELAALMGGAPGGGPAALPPIERMRPSA